MVTRSGDRQYELVPGWGKVPAGWEWGQVGGVAVDSLDRVYAFTRTRHPLMIFDRSGAFIDSWGNEIFEDAHGICIAADDSMYFVDRSPQLVLKFSREGRHRISLGQRGVHSDTGYTEETPKVGHAGGPFHHPTDVSVASSGEIYVSDGYRNCRVHKYAADGTPLLAWGEPGDGPGQFNLPHSVWEHKGRVYVADRANNRIQVFTMDGVHLETWPGFLHPTKIFVGNDDVMYVAELDARVSVLDLQGNVLARWGSERSHVPGEFWGPHGIWADSHGDIYVSEVLEGQRVQKFTRTK